MWLRLRKAYHSSLKATTQQDKTKRRLQRLEFRKMGSFSYHNETSIILNRHKLFHSQLKELASTIIFTCQYIHLGHNLGSSIIQAFDNSGLESIYIYTQHCLISDPCCILLYRNRPVLQEGLNELNLAT